MEDYDVPRPLNGDRSYQLPRYINVGRSVESELRYVAFQEEREREAGSMTSTAETEQSVAIERGERHQHKGTRGNGCRTISLVMVGVVVSLVSISALILSIINVTTPRRSTALLPLPVEACFRNSTMCNTSGGTENACSISGMQESGVVTATCTATSMNSTIFDTAQTKLEVISQYGSTPPSILCTCSKPDTLTPPLQCTLTVYCRRSI